MHKVTITAKAKQDITDCHDYIFDILKNEIAVDILLNKIEGSFRLLENDPEHFPKTNDQFLDLLNLGYIQINNYLCFYTIDNESKIVTILRCMYGKRDWKEILKNLP